MKNYALDKNYAKEVSSQLDSRANFAKHAANLWNVTQRIQKAGETHYGFKGNLLINSEGVITQITATSANVEERGSLWDLINEVRGMLIADKGLIGTDYQHELRQFAQIDLQTAVRSNMQEKRSDKFIKWLVSTRRLVETVIGQLTDRFHIEKVRARKLWYLTNRFAIKVLAHTICVFINKQNGNPPLDATVNKFV